MTVNLSRRGDNDGARETQERVLALAREFDDSWWAGGAMLWLGFWSLEDGELAQAAVWARGSAEVAAELGDRASLTESFALLASIAAARSDSVSAGRFWGVVDALEREREWLEPEWRARYAARVDPVRDPEFDAAAEAMRQLSPDDAVGAALAEID